MFQDTRSGVKLNSLRVVSLFTMAALLWLSGPSNAFAKGRPVPKPYSPLDAKGLTQTPGPALQKKIAAREAKEAQKAEVQRKAEGGVHPLTKAEMQTLRGRGAKRNAYFNGSLPWQRSFHDVNMCNGNLFKSFTDYQIAPARGAGLVLQRTYNSNDERVGPFGVGWTHAYDIRMEEAGVDPVTDKETVPRTDFFGGKHDYTRDADGLYTPPPYLFDEVDSKYDEFLASGPTVPLEDTQKGMDGTTKHFILDDNSKNSASTTRVCDWIEDRHGNRTTLAYQVIDLGPRGGGKRTLLHTVTDPSGRTLTFTWANFSISDAPAYRIVEVAGPSGTYRVTYEYYTNPGDLVSYLNLKEVHLDKDGLDRTTTYTYTTCDGESGLLASITDPLGHTVSYGYRLPTLEENWIQTIWVVSITEPAGVDASNTPRTQTWDISFRINSGAGVYAIIRSANEDGRFYMAVASDEQRRAVYLAAGQDEDGTFYYYWYDTSNNLIRTLNYADTYDAYYGNGYSGIGLMGKWYAAEYGPHGNVLVSGLQKYDFDYQSNPWLFPPTTTEYYDASKYFQKKKVTDSLGHVTQFDYYDNADTNVGNRGEVKWERDANYATTGKQYEYTYNQYGQTTSEKNLNDVITTYTYGDSWGNLTKLVQDPSNSTTSYTGLSRATSTSYDVYGKVLSSTDPSGRICTFTYNTLGQPTQANFMATYDASNNVVTPAETMTYSYGGNGRTNSVTDNRGTTSTSYEAGCDRVASVTDPMTGTIFYTYTRSGERKTRTLPTGGTTIYTYETENSFAPDCMVLPKDDLNSVCLRLARITDGQGRDVDISLGSDGRLYRLLFNKTYNQNGNLISYNQDHTLCEDNLEDPNNINYTTGRPLTVLMRTAWCYLDASNQPQEHVLSSNQYAYDDGGRRTANRVTDAQGNVRTEQYGYDALSHLTGVNYGDSGTAQVQSYTFDAMGNRLSKNDNATGNETYSVNAANMLTSRTVGSTTSGYTNDANGNTLTGGGRTNTWDSQNRLVKVVANGITSEFTYGSDGLRHQSLVTQSDGEQSKTDYVLDGQNVVQEVVRYRMSSASNWPTTPSDTVTYFMGSSGPVARTDITTSDARWYVYDGLGSVVGEVDASGNLQATKEHDVYGLTRSTAGTSGVPLSRHGFVGNLGHTEDDETGYIYMRARHYDPALGRFANEDPARDGSNWFTYCENNPVNSVDPSGKILDLLLGSLLSTMEDSDDAETSAAFQKYGRDRIGDACAKWSGKLFGEILASELEEYTLSFSPGYAKIFFGPAANDYIGLDLANHSPHLDIGGRFRDYIQRKYHIFGARRLNLFAEGLEQGFQASDFLPM